MLARHILPAVPLWRSSGFLARAVTGPASGSLRRLGARAVGLAALLAFGPAAEPLRAADPPPVIKKIVVVDHLLEIDGENLDLGSAPTVRLNATQLAVSTSSAERVTAQIPAALAAGSYKLRLRRPEDAATAKTTVSIGVVQIQPAELTTFYGAPRPSIDGNAAGYVFVGTVDTTVAQVTIARPGQRLVGGGSVVLGLAPGSPNQTFDIGLCYQATYLGAPLVNFAGSAYISQLATTSRALYTVTNVVAPAIGDYKVGVCVRNNGGPSALTQNDYINGWVMVVD